MIDAVSLQEPMRAFVGSLEEGHYYEAHEDLEALWFEHRTCLMPEVVLLKGYINAAVSFELERKGRVLAAQKPWGTFEKYLPQMLCLDPTLRRLFARGHRAIMAVKRLHVSLYRSDTTVVQSIHAKTDIHLNQKGTV